MSYVRAKLTLESMAAGEVLELTIAGGEHLENVPRSAEADGHRVLGVEEEIPGERYRMFIRRGADPWV
ncbi:MAG: sulfurtransferase TusA family protein [Planctomycetes bacterium]|nr:sulfurtransferase TusA family protein [Planctomycetota bacterium]